MEQWQMKRYRIVLSAKIQTEHNRIEWIIEEGIIIFGQITFKRTIKYYEPYG